MPVFGHSNGSSFESNLMRAIGVFAEMLQGVASEEERQAVLNIFRRHLRTGLEENDRIMWENNANETLDENIANEALAGEGGGMIYLENDSDEEVVYLDDSDDETISSDEIEDSELPDGYESSASR